MDDLLHRLDLLWVQPVAQALIKATFVILLGVIAAKIVNRQLRAGALSQTRLLLRRFLTGVILIITTVWALSLVGVDMSVLLGTAGFVTIAIGFAAQTSVSNLISGIFLMAEHPFKVGDVIEVSGTRGEVIVIDLMSVKLRTFDNLLVRIPNETMLKANLINITHFEIRRYDLEIGVAYKEKLNEVREIMFAVADKNPLCLRAPAPVLIFLKFGKSSIKYQFSVWAKRDSYLQLRNSIAEEIKEAFDTEGIQIPFPHRTIYTGSETAPMPVRLIADDSTAKRPDSQT